MSLEIRSLTLKDWRIVFIQANPHRRQAVFERRHYGLYFMRWRTCAARPLAWLGQLAVVVAAGKRAYG